MFFFCHGLCSKWIVSAFSVHTRWLFLKNTISAVDVQPAETRATLTLCKTRRQFKLHRLDRPTTNSRWASIMFSAGKLCRNVWLYCTWQVLLTGKTQRQWKSREGPQKILQTHWIPLQYAANPPAKEACAFKSKIVTGATWHITQEKKKNTPFFSTRIHQLIIYTKGCSLSYGNDCFVFTLRAFLP